MPVDASLSENKLSFSEGSNRQDAPFGIGVGADCPGNTGAQFGQTGGNIPTTPPCHSDHRGGISFWMIHGGEVGLDWFSFRTFQ